MSNGCVDALEVAASVLNGRPDVETTLITTGDRFGEPGVPRRSVDDDMALGDAGSAVVLGGAPGVVRLVSTAPYCVPFFGRGLTRNTCLKPLGITEDRPLTDWGLSLRHLSGSDQFVGLHRLIETGAVALGDHVLLFGAGSGFTWTTAVVRITGAEARCPGPLALPPAQWHPVLEDRRDRPRDVLRTVDEDDGKGVVKRVQDG